MLPRVVFRTVKARLLVRGRWRPLRRLLSSLQSLKTLETRERNKDSQPASAPGMPARSVMLKEEILAGIIDGREVHVSFGEFPYYLRWTL
ncbi:hypothetical protein L1987_01315 [Smallanthus sonchifolius]|uniref:Uncharacterized protein n=1 Tax=Smallanthus sonchifolius TaxID=185202 RepID=A0ACB9K4S1_9ASTR|nr:hypothetical protein L1987_01315 [Smallanthus sonchifolius]